MIFDLFKSSIQPSKAYSSLSNIVYSTIRFYYLLFLDSIF